ncbi:hypothetical protein V6N11_077614 [Hibiscus sabdariffa]|uniref:Uncharacterized protein n=1 Tax=Hibiscus sabdariffa TaxID=183260 RepID=A0ABR2TDK7_9ROSI
MAILIPISLWQSPGIGRTEINVDGTVSARGGGVANVVLRDEKGQWLYDFQGISVIVMFLMLSYGHYMLVSTMPRDWDFDESRKKLIISKCLRLLIICPKLWPVQI